MGTTTLRRRRLISSTNKIVCVSMSQRDFASHALVLGHRDEGIFIADILESDKAKLIVGDRIVAVNGNTLDCCSLQQAYHLLESSGSLINLIISR